MTVAVIILASLLSIIVGFSLGLVWAAYVMYCKAEQYRKAAWETIEDSRRITPRYQHAMGIAARCWCDPRAGHIEMDTILAQVFSEKIAEKIAEYIAALQWCSGASDFQHGGDGVPEGKAATGFDKICRPLMTGVFGEIDVSKLSPGEYECLREIAPEVLGLKGKDV